MKKIITEIVFAVVCVLIAWMVAVKISSLHSENARLTANQRTLIVKADYYRKRDSLSAASVEQLTLKNAEFKRYYDDLAKEAEALNLKVKRLQSVSRTVTETVYKVVPQWRDSVIYRDDRDFGDIRDTVRCATYSDK
jgi:hypothetical protein